MRRLAYESDLINAIFKLHHVVLAGVDSARKQPVGAYPNQTWNPPNSDPYEYVSLRQVLSSKTGLGSSWQLSQESEIDFA